MINGGRAVYLAADGKIYPFDITNSSHYDRFVGIAETSTVIGDYCTVVTHGVSTVVGSGWQMGIPYYIGANGFLSPNIPTVGLVKQIGVGINGERVLIMPHTEFEIIN